MDYSFTLDDSGVNILARALQTAFTVLDQKANELQPILQQKKEVAELQVELQQQLSSQQRPSNPVTPRPADPGTSTELDSVEPPAI